MAASRGRPGLWRLAESVARGVVAVGAVSLAVWLLWSGRHALVVLGLGVSIALVLAVVDSISKG